MRCFIIVLLLLSWRNGATQQYYETYSPANGLVDAWVTSILQDGTGRLFFLTRDGISIYDGQRFTNHTRLSGKPIGIVNDGILLPDGSLLLGNFNGEWIHCTRNTIELDTSFLQPIPELAKTIVSGQEHFLISNHGLFRLQKNNRVQNMQLPQPPGQTFSELVIWKDRIVFSYIVNENYMLYAASKEDGRLTDSLKIPPLYTIVMDKQGRIQVCTSTGILQLNTDELNKGKLKTEKSWFQDLVPSNTVVKNIFFDRQDNIWLIDEMTGCLQINPTTRRTRHYATRDGLLAGTRSIFQDKENNYWFVAPGKGVQKLVQTNYEVVTRLGNETVDVVLSSQADDDGRLFLFTNKNMLTLDKEAVESVPYFQPWFKGPVYYWQKNFWIYGSPGRLVSNKDRHIVLTDTTRDISHFPSPHCTTDREGNLLLAGNHISLIRKNETASTLALPYFADNIVSDDQDNYWAFCRSDAIVQFRVKDNKLVQQSSQQLNNIGPRYTLHLNKDTFWIATRLNGILIAKVNERSFSIIGRITRQQGLSNDFVETLLPIDGRRVAAGTASGLDIITIDGTDTLIENLSARINHFEPILQLSRDGQGMIYARTENYQLFKYNPDPTASPAYDPAAWISRITVNDRDIDSTQSSFGHLKNNFHFWVTSPSFTDSRSILFQFSLKEEKKQWQQNSSSADFAISNLPPGNYHLTVVIKYPGRIYADKKIDYYFTIHPPFWKTWWFITGLLGIIALCVLYFVKTYLHRQLQKQKMIMEKELAIEQERTKMARELHDGLGSMLSGVKHSFSAMKNQLELTEPESEKFHSNIDKLNDTIMELRNISHSMASESLLKYGLENSLKDYCQHTSQPGELDISFEALSTAEMVLTEEQSFHIFRIVQELLQNIIQHSGASHAIIQLSYNQRRLYLTVEDNGRGFEWGDTSKKARLNDSVGQGMGLKNIESRVKILHGRLDYQTAPEKGTSVMVEIPCKEKSKD